MGLNENNILKVVLDAAGQVTELKGLVAGEDTISSDLLNSDIRDAGSNAATALTTAQDAAASALGLSGYIDENQSTWESGGSPSAPGFENWNETSVGFNSFSADIQASTLGVCSIVDELETSSRNLSTIVDNSFSNLEASTRNLSAILDGSTNYPNTVVTSLEVSTRNLSGILDGSTNYPNTIVTNTFAGNSQLAADLDANGNSISNCASVSGSAGVLHLSSTFLVLTSPEGGVRIGPDTATTETWTRNKIQKAVSAYDYSLSAWKTVKDTSNAFLAGGGSAVASAIAVGNGSSVIVSGADDESVVVEDPQNGGVMIIDTAAARIKFRKINATNIDPAAGITGSQLEAGSITNTQLSSGAAATNLNAQTNSINFASLPMVSANSFVGNSHPTNGGTMSQISNTTARNMLGLSAGTAAPPSPDAGDLWYNTTDDELYTYDSGRGHWLGCPYYISFGKANAATNAGVGHFLYVGHQGTAATTSERGWLVPHDMVITGWRGHTQSTFDGWNARVDKNSGGTNTTGIVQTGAQGAVDTFSDFTLDVDVAAGDILGVALVLGSVTLNNSTVTVKIQRKGA